jgi:hypothetical protein
MSFRVSAVCGLVAISTGSVIAQNAAVPNTRPGSFEIAWHVSQNSAPIAIPESRFAETLTDLGRSNGQTWHRLSGRLYWTRLMSTAIEGGATTWGNREYSTSSRVLTLAFAHETLQHRRAVAIVQSLDLVSRRRTIPWAGAGIVLHRTSSRECITSAGRGFAGCTRRLVKDTAPVAAGGLKFYVDRHGFISAGGGLRLGDAPAEGFRGYWQVGGGASF